MKVFSGDRLTAVWAVLVAVTVVSFAVGGGHGGDGRRAATVVVLLGAFVKARLVGLHFMELRAAPVPLRLLFEGWGVVTAGVLTSLYLVGVS